jgi:hypothetical protein
MLHRGGGGTPGSSESSTLHMNVALQMDLPVALQLNSPIAQYYVHMNGALQLNLQVALQLDLEVDLQIL